MQFFAIVSLALAGLASAASIPEKRAKEPCKNMKYVTSNPGGSGGWGCINGASGCDLYYWKTSPPYYIVSNTYRLLFHVKDFNSAIFGF